MSDARFPPAPPPTRRGRKRLRLRRILGFARAAGTGDERRAGLEPAPTEKMEDNPNQMTSEFFEMRVAGDGDPRCDNIQCRLNGITFPISRRGGPMCPPVERCVTGTVSIKRYMSVIGGMGRRGRCVRRRASRAQPPRSGGSWRGDAARTALIGTCQ